MRRTTAFLATALLVAGAAEARGTAGVSVPLDQVRLIAFARPVSTIYIGNPVIADINMVDKRHAFVLGKAFGSTNIIALDAQGTEISNQPVIVFGSGPATVTLQRGTSKTTYACVASRCEAAPEPGDGKDTFDGAMDQIQKHQELLAKTAAGQ